MASAAAWAGVLGLACADVSGPPTMGLSATVADLQLYLRDDPYRSFSHLDVAGRNVFEVARWKIERLQRERSAQPQAWALEDFVLEFARARTLERLHLYRSSARAYERVAASATKLAGPAQEAARAMLRFSALSEPPLAGASDAPQQIGAAIEARIAAWNEAAAHERDPTYASLALEEAESWEMLRVSFLARHGRIEEAIAACEAMIERHRASKLYPKHLLQLGELHTQVARDLVVWSRAQQQLLGDSPYEEHVEAALAAFELASEARVPVFRREAQSRMQALLSYHDGVLNGVY